jgi:hypothetical protein
MNLPLLTPDTLTANTNSFLCCLYHTIEHVKFQNLCKIYIYIYIYICVCVIYCERSFISLTSKHPTGRPILVSSPHFPIQYIHRSPNMDYLVLIPNYNNSCAKHLHCIKQTLITRAWNRHHLTMIKCISSAICNHLTNQPTKYKLSWQNQLGLSPDSVYFAGWIIKCFNYKCMEICSLQFQ